MEIVGVALVGHVLAYIGPGAGLGALALTMALVLGVLLLGIGLVWYPLKRIRRGRAADVHGGSRANQAE